MSSVACAETGAARRRRRSALRSQIISQRQRFQRLPPVRGSLAMECLPWSTAIGSRLVGEDQQVIRHIITAQCRYTRLQVERRTAGCERTQPICRAGSVNETSLQATNILLSRANLRYERCILRRSRQQSKVRLTHPFILSCLRTPY